jgi:hypothetical protein
VREMYQNGELGHLLEQQGIETQAAA